MLTRVLTGQALLTRALTGQALLIGWGQECLEKTNDLADSGNLVGSDDGNGGREGGYFVDMVTVPVGTGAEPEGELASAGSVFGYRSYLRHALLY